MKFKEYIQLQEKVRSKAELRQAKNRMTKFAKSDDDEKERKVRSKAELRQAKNRMTKFANAKSDKYNLKD